MNLKKIVKFLYEETLIRVLREFGSISVITYVGGTILLFTIPNKTIIEEQIFWGSVGFGLLFLSFLIARFRMKMQWDKERALIEMNKEICNRLAEQLGKELSNEQVVSITQNIWQNCKDLISAIMLNDINIKETIKKIHLDKKNALKRNYEANMWSLKA